MTKISALIITHNEAAHIGQCIDSLAGVADEVVVVDSYSTDGTAAIARDKGAIVLEEVFTGFGPQKNLGAEHAAYDYILSVDADEELSAALRASIQQLKQSTITGSYYVHRLNHIGTQPIHSCGWYPDTRTRLYNKKEAKWDNRTVHEELLIHDKPRLLAGDLWHYSYDNYAEMKERADRYGRLGAESMKNKSKLHLLAKLLLNPIAKFAKSYILQKGFTDGYAGWMISRYKARETFLKYYLALQ